VTSPASGAGSAPDLPGYAPVTRPARSETERAASPGATTGAGNRRLGFASELSVPLNAVSRAPAKHVRQAPDS
jgi:hypothetical protein